MGSGSPPGAKGDAADPRLHAAHPHSAFCTSSVRSDPFRFDLKEG